MEQPKVTVVCMTYNHEKYIRDALDGFVMQKTDFPFLVIVHDDASTDGTAAIIREYADRYPDLIRPIYQTENQYSKHYGLTRVVIAPLVRTEYVAFCEGDDYWSDPDKLQKQYDFMESHPDYSLCACSTLTLNEETGKTSNRYVIPEDRDVTIEEIITERNGRVFQYGSFFLRTEQWNRWPEWRIRYPVGDTAAALLAASQGKVRMLSDVMTVYRRSVPGSWTTKIKDDNAMSIRAFERLSESLCEFDAATKGKYSDAVAEKNREFRYKLAVLRGDLKSLLSKELRPIFRSRGLRGQVVDLMQCKAPGLYRVLKNR